LLSTSEYLDFRYRLSLSIASKIMIQIALCCRQSDSTWYL